MFIGMNCVYLYIFLYRPSYVWLETEHPPRSNIIQHITYWYARHGIDCRQAKHGTRPNGTAGKSVCIQTWRMYKQNRNNKHLSFSQTRDGQSWVPSAPGTNNWCHILRAMAWLILALSLFIIKCCTGDIPCKLFQLSKFWTFLVCRPSNQFSWNRAIGIVKYER